MQGRAFQPGDILVTCDNMNKLPRGYVGHAAIVVAPGHVVEATAKMPQIRVTPIISFLRVHPHHVQYRPKSAEAGQRAAYCALDYVARYYRYLQQGIRQPVYSLLPSHPLEDPWRAIYCSKLVWLCYYYGAGYRFENDFLLFSPEDLDTRLSQDSHFALIYKHPSFSFKLDT
jgi:uncharacterized protein YycO